MTTSGYKNAEFEARTQGPPGVFFFFTFSVPLPRVPGHKTSTGSTQEPTQVQYFPLTFYIHIYQHTCTNIHDASHTYTYKIIRRISIHVMCVYRNCRAHLFIKFQFYIFYFLHVHSAQVHPGTCTGNTLYRTCTSTIIYVSVFKVRHTPCNDHKLS